MPRTLDRSFMFPVAALVLFCSVFLSACATRQVAGPKRPEQDVYVAIDAPDVMVEPYVPIDDGRPLTAEELAAFNSTGELDTNLSQEEKERVELFFKSYVHNYRSTVERFLKRSEVYLPFVEEVLRERKLPVELACLAFVESGFNPNAVSRAGATGMWQFMPFTGKKYGLAQGRWMDERRDPYKSTHAAADYLTKLYEFFDKDWHLAIAAYNAGEGKIARALAETDAKDFFELCRRNDMLEGKVRLKEETQQYLPRFLAFTKILRNVESLGFARPDPGKAPRLATVTVPAGIDLRQFARDIKLDWEQFKGLNPAYLRFISPPDGTSVARVPEARETAAVERLARKDVAVYAGWRDYRVRRGDSLGKIAQRAGATTALLRLANGKKSNSLRVGEYLLVPGSARAARASLKILAPEDVPVIARAKDGKPLGGYAGTHSVESGDTLYALALAWDSSVDDICLLNDIEPSSKLRLGQKLYIPSGRNVGAALAAKPAERTPEAKPAVSLASSVRAQASRAKPQQRAQADASGKTRVIQAGDTLYSLARTHGTSVAAIAKRNGIGPNTTLRLGQIIHLP